MDFTEAEQQKQQLSAQLAQGQITQAAYIAAINAIRVTDSSERWWQPSPQGPGWLYWDGKAWIPGTPAAAGTKPPGQELMSIHEFKKISKDVPLAKRPQKWWDLLSILGGVAAAIIWFLYGGLREGFDVISAVLMIAIPVGLVFLRADIDSILLPLQPTRQKIPRLVLIGLGLVIPFLTAWILYNIFNISQYPLMQANIIIGTLASYAIVRDPVLAKGNTNRPTAGVPSGIGIVYFVLFASMLAVPVMADDCTRDPLNAQDCLRTGGFAEVMAGTAGAGLGVLVNGPIVIQGLVQGGAATATGATPSAPGTSPQAQALMNQRNLLVRQQADLRKKWFDRKVLEEAVHKAKMLDHKHAIRALFLGGKKVVDGITDPKGQIYDGVKKKLGIETPLDKLKDGVFGKEVEMADIGKDWKAARDEFRRLQAELNNMPSQEDMLTQNRGLNQQIWQIDSQLQKLKAGGK